MTIKLGKTAKVPGENIIQTGILFCLLGVFLYLLGAFNGVTNGLTLLGGGILGLLMICAGYLKRIAAALMSKAETSVPVASEISPS